MYLPEVERYTYYSKRILSLSKIYSNYLINRVNTNPFIVILNFTPIFITNFLVNFTDIVILITKKYDFTKDPLFDLKGNYNTFDTYSTLIRGLYWNSKRIDEKIKAGFKITDRDLQYEGKQTPIIIEKIDIAQLVNRYNQKKLPVLIIDATNMDTTAYIPVNNVKSYEVLRMGKPEKNELTYKVFGPLGEDIEENKNKITIPKKNKINRRVKKEILREVKEQEEIDKRFMEYLLKGQNKYERIEESSGSDSGSEEFIQ